MHRSVVRIDEAQDKLDNFTYAEHTNAEWQSVLQHIALSDWLFGRSDVTPSSNRTAEKSFL